MLTLTLGLTAAVFVLLSIPLIRRKVRPNPFYGFRTPSTMRDERLWYEVNAKQDGIFCSSAAVWLP